MHHLLVFMLNPHSPVNRQNCGCSHPTLLCGAA